MKNCPLILMFTVALSLNLSAQNRHDQDRLAISQLVSDMAVAWSNGNGAGFASVFAPVHDFIVWNGYYMKAATTEMNAQNHQRIFDTMYKNTDHYNTIDQIRFVKDDVALIHVFAAVVKKGEGRPQNPMVLWTGLVEKMDGQWKITSFHNLDLEVFESEETMKYAPMPPEAMYASWYDAQ